MNVIPEGLEPVDVWDCNDPGSAYWVNGWREAYAWAQVHVRDADRTVRADFYLLDMPFAVVHRLSLDEHGEPFVDPDTGEVAMDGPSVEPLAALPPAHLLRTAT